MLPSLRLQTHTSVSTVAGEAHGVSILLRVYLCLEQYLSTCLEVLARECSYSHIHDRGMGPSLSGVVMFFDPV